MLLSAPEMIAKTPLNIVNYLFFADASALSRAKLAAAFAETLPITFVGLMLGRGSALTMWATIWVTFFRPMSCWQRVCRLCRAARWT